MGNFGVVFLEEIELVKCGKVCYKTMKSKVFEGQKHQFLIW